MGAHLLLCTVLILIGKALSQYGVRIDCGSETRHLGWQTDKGYTETGENRNTKLQSFSWSPQLYTLRVFSKHKKNCYTLPVLSSTLTASRYLIRASFYYGNYDGHSKPPTFNLELEGNKWTTVATSNTEPQFQEIIYYAKKDNVSICLVQTKKNEYPFINALEYWSINEIFDSTKFGDTTWITSYRYNYGADGDDWIIGYPDDNLDKIWKRNFPTGLVAMTADPGFFFISCNDLPDSIASRAVEAENPTGTISLAFTFNGTDLQHYISMYFIELNQSVTTYYPYYGSVTRNFDIYLNNNYTSTVSMEFSSCRWEQAIVTSDGNLNVQLRPNGNSTLPPLITAIEVYTAYSPKPSKGSKKKKNLGLLIGLPIGLAMGLLFPALVIILVLWNRNRRPPRPVQANPLQGFVPAMDNGGHAQPVVGQENRTPVAAGNVGTDQMLSYQEFDREELS